MEEQKKYEEASNKRVLDLLTELAQVQSDNALLMAQIFVREGRNQVKGKVDALVGEIQEQSKSFGRKAQTLAQQYKDNRGQKGDILQAYEQALFEINAEYAKRMKVVMGEKQDLEVAEQETYSDEKLLRLERRRIKNSPEYLKHMEEEKRLSSEIKKAFAHGELDVVTQKTEELKSLRAQNPLTKIEAQIGEVQTRRDEIGVLLGECEEGIEACRHERFEKIEEIKLDKNNQLAVIPKQNLVQKIFGNLLNRVNGLSKFKNGVEANIKGKIETINEYLPVVQKSVQEKCEQFVGEMQNKREQLQEKATDTRDAILEKAKGAKDTVVEKATDIRYNIVEAAKGARDKAVSTTRGVKDKVVTTTNMAQANIRQGVQNIKATIEARANQTYNSIINRGRQAKASIKTRLQQAIDASNEKNTQLLSRNQGEKEGETVETEVER